MRDDLLGAQAAVDWAVAQLPVLEKRTTEWLLTHPHATFREFDPQRGKDAVKVRVRNPMPVIVGAEVGVIVHSIRSALDILACALAGRNGVSNLSGIYFPVCSGPGEFADAEKGEMKKIKRLAAPDIAAIETLKPYKGGNDLLYSLHHADITRKHRRLIQVLCSPSRWGITGFGLNAEFDDGTWARLEDGAVLTWIDRAAADYKVEVTPEITLDERLPLPRQPLLATLRDFSSLATNIIALFDR